MKKILVIFLSTFSVVGIFFLGILTQKFIESNNEYESRYYLVDESYEPMSVMGQNQLMIATVTIEEWVFKNDELLEIKTYEVSAVISMQEYYDRLEIED